MDQQTNKIECPNCGHKIDVNDILYHQVDEELRKKYNDDLAREKNKYQSQLDSLNEEREKLEGEKKRHDEAVADAINAGLKEEKTRLQIEIRARMEEEQSERIRSLQEELDQKSGQLKEFNKAKSEIERLKREKGELKDSIEAESEKKLSEMIGEEKEKIRKTEEQRSQLKLSEKEKVIEQLSEQLKDAQRKAEQGSTQLQGEVQELAIEEWLSVNFPLDTIEEIKKGARGADCLQIVNTRTRRNCGTIYYESKRTKGFQPGWIEKFKTDIREKGADIGVLVTESMPADMERMGLKDGIWVCTFEEFRGLCVVLRDSVIRLSNAVAIQENKGDKMGMIYDYLTGNEFRLQVEAIVEGFTQMQTDLESEKRAMNGIWKKREKQIQKVLLNTNYMYSSVKGIAGSAVQPVQLLELPVAEDNDDI
ncbi:MAG: DUF2130 domain-containing protein [Deltaproteobacteria bacterium]|nr:DUF2130 domain-containing protein [Deltaproteobacteria bacterium]MBW2596384.1 DUF2130 domain-containing protein [Deltaproteobacteria bacterium]MBW2649770.1 DUF2130 domain-containing protein [Deltaproteobacteria bacterium]